MSKAITQRSGLTLDNLRSWLNMNTNLYDDKLELALQAALEEADTYCNNDFLTSTGGKGPIPSPVKVWCLRYAARLILSPEYGIDQESLEKAGVVRRSQDYNVKMDQLKPYRRVLRFGTRRF